MNEAAALLAAVEIGDPLLRGSLALFPLFHELAPARPYLSGARGAPHLEIRELEDGAVVPELEVTNASALPVLLLDGESLVGARQNRIVVATTVLPPASTQRVAVTCVEAGRWGAEQPMHRSARHAPGRLRAHNRRAAAAHAMADGEVAGDQAAVWAEVDQYAARYDVHSDTSAMEAVHEAAAASVDALFVGTAPLKGQCGVAVAIGDRVSEVDLFDSPDALVDYWDGLVAGYALDDDQSASPKRPRRREVRRVLADVSAGRGVDVGGRLHIVTDRTTTTAVLLDDVIVHLAVTAG
jgi:hypothetical protein